MTFPIAIIGFNRPQYLGPVMASLAEQRNVKIDCIALFQDGAVNPKSGERYAEDHEIAADVEVFKRYFPKGEVFGSDVNLGIAHNIDRAERWIFEELKTEAGIFFEDDMIVTKYYLQTLEALIRLALDDERIGYVSCYGNPEVPLSVQEAHPYEFIPLQHHWGFAITRRQFLKSKPYVDDYLDLICERDYLRPDLEAIRDLLAGWGVAPLLPAQDVIRSAICCKTKSVRLNTLPCLGKYIGVEGTHHTAEVYELGLYAQTQLYPRPVTKFNRLPDAQYDYMLERSSEWLANGFMTQQAKKWLAGLGLMERNWPNFSHSKIYMGSDIDKIPPPMRRYVEHRDSLGRRRI
jgi:hypothetical protein